MRIVTGCSSFLSYFLIATSVELYFWPTRCLVHPAMDYLNYDAVVFFQLSKMEGSPGPSSLKVEALSEVAEAALNDDDDGNRPSKVETDLFQNGEEMDRGELEQEEAEGFNGDAVMNG